MVSQPSTSIPDRSRGQDAAGAAPEQGPEMAETRTGTVDKAQSEAAKAKSKLWANAHEIHENEHALLQELRSLRRLVRKQAKEAAADDDLTLGQRVADKVADVMGSWTFIIIQSAILLVWVLLNVLAWVKSWDPYPFILLNLALSFQAAYAAPIIMMSQNRQQDIDRKAAENDYRINIKAELEIELLHHKLDNLREQEVLELTKVVRELSELLTRFTQADDARGAISVPSPAADQTPVA